MQPATATLAQESLRQAWAAKQVGAPPRVAPSIQSNPIQFYPIQSNSIQSNPIQSNPIQSNPIQSGLPLRRERGGLRIEGKGSTDASLRADVALRAALRFLHGLSDRYARNRAGGRVHRQGCAMRHLGCKWYGRHVCAHACAAARQWRCTRLQEGASPRRHGWRLPARCRAAYASRSPPRRCCRSLPPQQ
jgi:hypothetical protein